jgi:hypothetical protein
MYMNVKGSKNVNVSHCFFLGHQSPSLLASDSRPASLALGEAEVKAAQSFRSEQAAV